MSGQHQKERNHFVSRITNSKLATAFSQAHAKKGKRLSACFEKNFSVKLRVIDNDVEISSGVQHRVELAEEALEAMIEKNPHQYRANLIPKIRKQLKSGNQPNPKECEDRGEIIHINGKKHTPPGASPNGRELAQGFARTAPKDPDPRYFHGKHRYLSLPPDLSIADVEYDL